MRPSHFVARYMHYRGYRVISVNPSQAGNRLFGEVVPGDLSGLANKNMDISTNQHNAADLAHTQLSTDKLDSFHKQITSTVLFPFDSSSLSKESKNILDTQIEWLIVNNKFNNNVIEGHCDMVGTREYNLALGERRAEQVKRYMVGCGVSSDRLVVVSYGKEKPAQIGDTDDVKATNRRVVLVPGIK